MVGPKQLVAFDDRIASFRAQKVGNGSKRNIIKAWPHSRPSVTQMARAGFFFNPSSQSPDNVTCFLCDKDLDGWSKGDDPKQEHLDHSPRCAWAIINGMDWNEDEDHDPDSTQMRKARLDTFANWWPHDGKRGWVPTSTKMCEAGFFYNPSRTGDDMAACLYCGVVLDGWEPKDNPLEEHRKRGLNCFFFTRIHEMKKGHRTSKARQSTSKKATSRKRASSASVVEDSDADLGERKLKRQANKRNSRSTRSSSVGADKDEDINTLDSQSAQSNSRRLSTRLAVSRDNTTYSSVPTSSIMEVEELEQEEMKPEPVPRKARGPRPLTSKSKKELNADVLDVDKVINSDLTASIPETKLLAETQEIVVEDDEEPIIEDVSHDHSHSLNTQDTKDNPQEISEKIKVVNNIITNPETLENGSETSLVTTTGQKDIDGGLQTETVLERTPKLTSSQKSTPLKSKTGFQNATPISQSSAVPVHASLNEITTSGRRRVAGPRTVANSSRTTNDATPPPVSKFSETESRKLHDIVDSGHSSKLLASRDSNVLGTKEQSNSSVLYKSPVQNNDNTKSLWTRRSIAELLSATENENEWLTILGFENGNISVDEDNTVEEWILHNAELGEKAFLARCENMLETLQLEDERALRQLEQYC
ncbi:hypothetical protein V1514DRAFT_334832 [Lipomyces japonicus]|uniref:uncharacterized protein n=1 Tax=Lipomyces japonicus TaxID=56871 RepID=UPI0034CFD64E